jgi:hypothetical protein
MSLNTSYLDTSTVCSCALQRDFHFLPSLQPISVHSTSNMPKRSAQIKRLPPIHQTSRDAPIPARGFIEQLINRLAAICDKVEDIHPEKFPTIKWGKSGTRKEQQEALCKAIVKGTNEIYVAVTKLDTEKSYPSM